MSTEIRETAARRLTEVFETVDIEHADEACYLLGRLCQALVDNGNQPIEETGVDELGHRIPDDDSLGSSEGGDDLLRPRGNLLLDCPLLVLSRVDAEQVDDVLDMRIVFRDESVVSRLLDLDVADVEQGTEELKYL